MSATAISETYTFTLHNHPVNGNGQERRNLYFDSQRGTLQKGYLVRLPAEPLKCPDMQYAAGVPQ